MAGDQSGPEAALSGAVEGIKGKAKEVAGAVTGNDDLHAEGKAQQDKAASEREVAAKEAEADKERAKAKALEAEQKSHQD